MWTPSVKTDPTIIPAEPGWFLEHTVDVEPNIAFWEPIIAWLILEDGRDVQAIVPTHSGEFGPTREHRYDGGEMRFVHDPAMPRMGGKVPRNTPRSRVDATG